MLHEIQVIDYDLEEMPYVPASENISKALEFAREAHQGQLRKTGEPFINHLISVVNILESAGLNAQHNENILVAALLHDTVEDNAKISLEGIRRGFGPDVARIVDGVTKVDSVDGDMDTIKKIAESGYLDPSVLVVKLADRLHNMQTLGPYSDDKRRSKAQETMDKYVGIAKDLGLWEIKRQMEDLCFMYLEPVEYKRIKELVDNDRRRTDVLYQEELIAKIQNHLKMNGISAKVLVRYEGYYAMYIKQREAILAKKTSTDRGIQDITDLVSYRINVSNIQDVVMGDYYVSELFGRQLAVHRHNNYIGPNTRPNGYSAIHNTLIDERGAIELALVTDEMENYNNWGIVTLMAKGEIEKNMRVMNCIISPEGKTRLMLKESTGVDYAYRISPQVGLRAVGMLVNSEMRSITEKLKNGDVVEIITDAMVKVPNSAFLDNCAAETKVIIEQQINTARSRELLNKGTVIAAQWLSPRGVLRFEILPVEVQIELVNMFKLASLNDLYRSLAIGAIPKTTLDKFLDDKDITKKALGLTTIRASGPNDRGILIEYIDGIANYRGDIIANESKVEGGNFAFEIVAKGLSRVAELMLRDLLHTDPNIHEYVVV